MGQKEKLIRRLKSKPKNFTFDDAETLLKYLDKERQVVHELCLQARNTEAYCSTNRIHKRN